MPEHGAALAVFPELGLSGYAISDLLHQSTLLDAVEDAIASIVAASAELLPLLLVGAPLRHAGALYNAAVAIHRGRLLGVVPKVHLPNYREFYEPRHFVVGDGMVGGEITIRGHTAPFGTDLLFAAEDVPGLVVHAEICEDIWIPVPPSSEAALAGATVLANLSASNITIGKAETRRLLCRSQSARCVAAYLYAAAGAGRIHHRPCLGRPGVDLRERRDPGRDRALSLGQPARDRRHRPRSAAPRADADGQFRYQPPAQSGAVPSDRVPARTAARRYRLRAPDRALSVRAGGCQPARAGLLRGVQHPGVGACTAAARDRHQARGDRRVRRARFDAGADRLRAGAGSAWAAPLRHPRLHHAGLCHLRAHQGQCDPTDGGARRHLARARHPTGGAAHAGRYRPPVRAAANRSTT